MFVKAGKYEEWPVSVDGAALFNYGHNGGEVVVAEDYLRGGPGQGGARFNGDNNLGLVGEFNGQTCGHS